MTDKLNNFVNTNMRWIILIIGAIVILYLNSIYATREEFDTLKIEVEIIKTEFLLMKQENQLKILGIEKDNETMDGRLEKKIKVLNEVTNNINKLHIKLTELETIIKK